MTDKTCTKCGEEKEIDQFNKNGTQKGIQYYRTNCKLCERLRNSRYRSDNASKIKIKNDAFRVNNPEYFRIWRSNNLNYNKDWRKSNPLRVKVLRDRWADSNLDKIQNSRIKYRAYKQMLFHHNVPDSYLISRDSLLCGWCSTTLPSTLEFVHRDHIIPLSLNGPHTHWNLTLACASCNLSKGAKHPLQFATITGLHPSAHILRLLDLLRLAQTPAIL